MLIALASTAVVIGAAPIAGWYAATPQAALLRAFGFASQGAVQIVRINQTNDYAVILSRGLSVEGEPLRDPVLLQKFGFGWQAIEIANFRCRIEGHIPSARERRRLFAGMPHAQNEPSCGNDADRDVGPRADVEAVRRQMAQPLVPAVAVAGDFALAGWYGAGGGESLFRRTGGQWRRLTGGGGALGTAEMRSFGVPEKLWCRLGVTETVCLPTGPG